MSDFTKMLESSWDKLPATLGPPIILRRLHFHPLSPALYRIALQPPSDGYIQEWTAEEVLVKDPAKSCVFPHLGGERGEEASARSQLRRWLKCIFVCLYLWNQGLFWGWSGEPLESGFGLKASISLSLEQRLGFFLICFMASPTHSGESIKGCCCSRDLPLSELFWYPHAGEQGSC